MKRQISRAAFWVIVAAAAGFSVFAFVRASATSDPAEPPGIEESPAVIHGFVEPAGREVFVCAQAAGRVVEIHAAEGDTVKAGDLLCSLDKKVESREVDLAEARVKSAEKSLELSTDFFERQRDLFESEAISELAYTSARIEAQRDSAEVLVARSELERARAVLEQMELRAPVDGVVYRMDVRLGEMLSPEAEGGCPIMLGAVDLWVRMYVESFWAGRVGIGSEYDVIDSETGEPVGRGRVISKSSYITRKDYRSEEPGERFDTGYLEAVMELEPSRPGLPVGLSVFAVIRAGQRAEGE